MCRRSGNFRDSGGAAARHRALRCRTEDIGGRMKRLLEAVNLPEDIRGLSHDELGALAREVREEVISVVSEVGGHLASTLGAVELTLALHYVFDSPEDRIVWDTGHQAYAHK